MSERGRRAPNILLVVMDCAGTEAFDESLSSPSRSPTLSRMRSESTVFERAASTSNWTSPSHASLLSGDYPWQLSSTTGGVQPLHPTLPSMLGRLGYATALFSANHNLRPESGLTRGFDFAAWGTWGENSLRRGKNDWPPYVVRGLAGNGHGVPRVHVFDWRFLSSIAGEASDLLPRFPIILDASSRLFQRITNPGRELDYRVSPWIEPALNRWLSSVSSKRPVFCFINLMEGHEPFLPPRDRTWNFGKRRLDLLRVRQDRAGWLKGYWEPTREDYGILRRLYVDSLRLLDDRLSRIVGVLEALGKWDNTLMVLTSDHGQAFGEHAMLFHGNWTHEPELRVPLWIRYPEGARTGVVRTSTWASIRDIPGTVLRYAGSESALSGENEVLLDELADRSRAEPIFAFSEGVAGPKINPSNQGLVKSRLIGAWVTGYYENWKVSVRVGSKEIEVYDLSRDAREETCLEPGVSPDAQRLVDSAVRIASRVGSRVSAPRTEAGEQRLRGWGYL